MFMNDFTMRAQTIAQEVGFGMIFNIMTASMAWPLKELVNQHAWAEITNWADIFGYHRTIPRGTSIHAWIHGNVKLPSRPEDGVVQDLKYEKIYFNDQISQDQLW
jgi:hypothetical protein